MANATEEGNADVKKPRRPLDTEGGLYLTQDHIVQLRLACMTIVVPVPRTMQ
jgi:hypothetical protein